ncbi:flagellar biosynthesis anti-sigma factor FlgM [Teredinibacter waterburyi]|uniref:flagellar biosynthesis anti-sigma factor FlgM n=1 Tax=Teredinibacter waterburyi TaxID=1500538 RepID=UPI00165FABD4|nr:flagellar biosynthesis anti-sigma factor FlgM [Teredinibacter waterburyi]
MVIEPGNNINTGSNVASAKSRAPTGKAAEDGKPESTRDTQPGDSVSISNTAQTLAKVEASLAQVPDVDEAKVNGIRAAIENGSYSIDYNAIADGMLAHDQLLSS